VDEAAVVIENIHTQMGKQSSIARAIQVGTAETTVPNLLAMLCILAVFLPSSLMEGAAHGLFVPLAFAVGFAMIFAFILSITFVPVLSVWLLRLQHADHVGRVRTRFHPAHWLLRKFRSINLALYRRLGMRFGRRVRQAISQEPVSFARFAARYTVALRAL
jgi:multidrug efflux pump subunit AcrB